VSTGWRHRRIKLDWGRLSVQVAGTGPPILLLHGLGGSGRYWAGLGPLLDGTRTLIAPDLAGFGRSDKPGLDYAREFHLDTIDSLLAALHIEGQVAVAGHSMGGVLAALFARRHPEAVESLALVATPFPRQKLRPNRMPNGPVRVAVYRFVQRLLPALSPLVRSATFPRAVIADYLRHTVDSYQKTSHALLWDPTAAADLLGLDDALRGRPQMFLYSNEDTTIAGDSLERWRAVLPDAAVVIVPGAHQLLLRDHFATLAGWFEARVTTPGAVPSP
jgi:pimeloyl-ACP methyl ester carboxylesterase